MNTNADVQSRFFRLAKPLTIATHLILHCERGVARAQRVVLVRQRRTEQRHDAIAQNLVNGPLVFMNRIHHDAKNWINNSLSRLGIDAFQQLGRSEERRVGKEWRSRRSPYQ